MTVQIITSPDDPALDELCQRARRGSRRYRPQRPLAGRATRSSAAKPAFTNGSWNRSTADKVGAPRIRSAATWRSLGRASPRRSSSRSGPAPAGGSPAADNEALKQRLLPGLASGELFTTVGISHLTTSRRHLGRPVLAAEETASGFRLDGMSPWVTGGAAADVIVMAATLVENGEPTDRELLLAVPTDLAGPVGRRAAPAGRSHGQFDRAGAARPRRSVARLR